MELLINSMELYQRNIWMKAFSIGGHMAKELDGL